MTSLRLIFLWLAWHALACLCLPMTALSNALRAAATRLRRHADDAEIRHLHARAIDRAARRLTQRN